MGCFKNSWCIYPNQSSSPSLVFQFFIFYFLQRDRETEGRGYVDVRGPKTSTSDWHVSVVAVRMTESTQPMWNWLCFVLTGVWKRNSSPQVFFKLLKEMVTCGSSEFSGSHSTRYCIYAPNMNGWDLNNSGWFKSARITVCLFEGIFIKILIFKW